MSRFYDADVNIVTMVNEIIYERFPNLRAAAFKVMMDSKTKVDKLTEKVTFAYIKCANEVEKFLTKSGQNISGVDYFLFINDLVWELADEKNKKRIISHELRHAFLDEKGNFKTIKHDIEDFYAEVKLNEDDPMWGQALATIAMAKIEHLKEEAKG